MAFQITLIPPTRIEGVRPTSAEFGTAQEALLEVERLEASEQRIAEIVAPDGRTISAEELKAMAQDGWENGNA